MNPTNHIILLTIDVEDWFQVENFKQCIPFSSWPSRELRVEKNTHKILGLLDSQQSEVRSQRTDVRDQKSENRCQRIEDRKQKTESSNSTSRRPATRNQHQAPSTKQQATSNQIRATFFVLGWIAERLPHLVREIHARGHEVASHGYNHNLCNQQSHDALKKDLTDSKKFLEDIIGAPIFGYRAPSFSIDKDILKIIQDCGYLYDSSYNSFNMHGRYGQLTLSQNGKKGIALQIQSEIRNPHTSTHYQLSAMSHELCLQPATLRAVGSTSLRPATSNKQPATRNQFYELPISNLKFSPHGAAIRNPQSAIRNLIFPWGGGAYFRLIPFPLFKLGVEAILKKQKAYLFYVHPWEIDPKQPKVKDSGTFHRVRHYTNLSKTHAKLLRLIQSFQHCHFVTCSQYLSAMS